MRQVAPGTISITRLYSLDFVRGIAAMAVIFWHWQHFFLTSPGEVANRSVQPFYAALQPLYDYGWIAVDIFFCLSGFVFFWLYTQSIAEKKMSARHFSIMRFSRLYPLHIATLIYMLVAQTIMYASNGRYFVYTVNDVTHFVKNLLFVQAWGFNVPESFNGPAWSVSVEILLYASFFLVARARLADRTIVLLGIAAIGAICLFLIDRQIGRGILEFYLGGAVYHAWSKWAGRLSVRASRFLLGLMLGLLLAELLILRFDIAHQMIQSLASSVPFLARLDPLLDPAFLFYVRVIQIPVTVFAFAVYELRSGTKFYEGPARLGDITYASYLLHVPLQITMAIGAARGFFPTNWLKSSALLPIFFAMLIGLSILVYKNFELPMQRWLRKKLMS